MTLILLEITILRSNSNTNQLKKVQAMVKKQYSIKILKKRAGQNAKFSHKIFSGFDKKQAFVKARKELIKIANCDINYGVSESSENDILKEIESIKNGSDNYYHDQTTWSFKIFSKKVK